MLGATQLLMMSSMDSHQQANLNIITASIDQLREVLSNVLDLAKLKKGAMELEQAPFDLPGILHQVACACVRCAAPRRPRQRATCACVCIFAVAAASVATSSAANADSGDDAPEQRGLLQIVLDYLPSLPVMVVGDELRLKQVCAGCRRQCTALRAIDQIQMRVCVLACRCCTTC